MLKPINLQSLLQAKCSLSERAFQSFLKHYDIEIRDAEIDDIKVLAGAMSDAGCSIKAFDAFYIGYKIPQISSEFDLLRLGINYLINIELKRVCPEEKIKNQLLRNKYYLSPIGKKVYAFTFVSESQKLFFLRDDETLERISVIQLVELLISQDVEDLVVLDKLFDPSEYLVSPFNSTEKFLKGNYFLTSQQKDFKNQIISLLRSAKSEIFLSISGGAGTGKTLLAYDIARYFISNKLSPLIIHCGQLNEGHAKLEDHGWMVASIKSYNKLDFEGHDLIIIDEAQRIRPKQLDVVVEKVQFAQCGCIFSYDKRQTLSADEEKSDACSKIVSVSTVNFQLSNKIRTNKEIAAFIRMVFNKKESISMHGNESVEINYFYSSQDAKKYLESLDKRAWEVLRFTPSRYMREHHTEYSESTNKTSHEVIGQEFDGVVVVVDKFFSYDENGNLIYKSKAYYDAPKMLYQNATRARKKLSLVIISNEEILTRCLSLLQNR